MPFVFPKKRENIPDSEEKTELSNGRIGKENNERKKIAINPQVPKYALKDIILTAEQDKSIHIALAFDKHRDLLMNEWGMKKLYPEKKGLLINLYGESGTGKTMVAHAIAGALKKSIIIVNYAEIESKYVGETSKNLLYLFEQAEAHDAVLLFDEADALLSSRVTKMSSSTDVSVNQTKSVLLNILNDFCGIVVFTTNFITNYDFAFVRRIPFQIRFDLPNEEQRSRIWSLFLSCGIPYNCDIDALARDYDEISGSDISNAVWNAALEAAENGDICVEEKQFRNAIEAIKKAKADNRGSQYEPKVVSVREVDEEYALSQIGRK